MLLTFSSLADQEKAPAFLQAAPFWPLHEPKSQSVLEHTLTQPANWYLYCAEQQWQWLAGIQTLDFDSQLFGFAMARLEPVLHSPVWPDKDSLLEGKNFFQALQVQASAQGVEFLMARVGSRDMLAAQCMEKAGFSLVDVSVEWGLDLSGLPLMARSNEFILQPWEQADRDRLLSLAGAAFSDLSAYADRFALDDRLRPFSVRLYETWLDNCFKGEQASQVLVLKKREMPVGFIALRLPVDSSAPGWVVLNAIEPGQRGQGLYNYMLLAGLNWLKGNGATMARVRTKLSQQAVIQAWSRLGGRQLGSDMSFHWWSEHAK